MELRALKELLVHEDHVGPIVTFHRVKRANPVHEVMLEPPVAKEKEESQE